MSGETQQPESPDNESEGDGRAWTPPPPHETPEPRLDDRYSSNLSQRPTPLAALDDLSSGRVRAERGHARDARHGARSRPRRN